MRRDAARSIALRVAGARHVLSKICSTFDSTDAGNIGPVMDALKADGGAPFVLVCPAFPETGRTIYQGHLFVGDMPLDESPLKDHPLNPMRDANLVRVLGRQSASKVGLVNLAIVQAGVEAVLQRVAVLQTEGCSAAILDAVGDADLDIIAQAALHYDVSVGASGLGLGLARALPRRTEAVTRFDRSLPPGPMLCLAGSCSAATLQQVDAAEKVMPVLRLDVARLLASDDEAAGAIAWAKGRMQHGAMLISSAAPPKEVAALQGRHRGATIGALIEQRLASISVRLTEDGVRRLTIAGGETSGAVIDKLAIPAFIVGPEIAAGVPLLRSIGWQPGEMLVALKSGNFGGVDFFADAWNLMR